MLKLLPKLLLPVVGVVTPIIALTSCSHTEGDPYKTKKAGDTFTISNPTEAKWMIQHIKNGVDFYSGGSSYTIPTPGPSNQLMCRAIGVNPTNQEYLSSSDYTWSQIYWEMANYYAQKIIHKQLSTFTYTHPAAPEAPLFTIDSDNEVTILQDAPVENLQLWITCPAGTHTALTYINDDATNGAPTVYFSGVTIN